MNPLYRSRYQSYIIIPGLFRMYSKGTEHLASRGSFWFPSWNPSKSYRATVGSVQCCSRACNTLKGLPLKHDLFLTLPARDWLSPSLHSQCECACVGSNKTEMRERLRGRTREGEREREQKRDAELAWSRGYSAHNL